MGFRLAIYLMQQIQANAWDSRREQVILQEVRRGRRALQILAAACSTAHDPDLQFTGIADALLRNDNKSFPRPPGMAGAVFGTAGCRSLTACLRMHIYLPHFLLCWII